MALLNINSLSKHIDELVVLMHSKPLDILAINESKLDHTVSNNSVALSGYNLERRDRDKHGGGVCVYLRNSINYKRRTDLEDSNLEMIVLEISKPNSKPFLITTWYRPPKSSLELFDKFELFLNKVDGKFKEIYILGDLNCNFQSNPPENHTKHIMNLMINYQLTQIITNSTRVSSISNSLIDVFITNSSESIISSGVYPLSISDHDLIYAIRKIGIPKGKPRYIECRNFKNFDEKQFTSSLKSTKWPLINEFDDINKACDAWKSVFLEIIDKHAPCRSFRVRNKPCPWINSELKQKMFARDSLKKKAMLANNPEIWLAYRRQRNVVSSEIKKVKKQYFQSEINANRGNPKETWKILNDAMGRKFENTEINKLSTSLGQDMTESVDIANYFNSHFVEIGPKLASNVPTISGRKPDDFMTKVASKFNFQKIYTKDVIKLIEKLNLRKASGHDKISNKLLKLAGPYICQSLTDLFNLSIELKSFASDWKIAKVFPLHKSGERDDANNYRPISVLSTIARLFERLMYDQLYSYLTEYDLIDTRQSGFRSLHSTLTALLDMSNQWCFNIDRGMVNGVIFLDLKKAFDTIDHEILLMKLAYYGIDDQSLMWFRSYLNDRQQVCHVNGVYSRKDFITCGVPQGSILGPVLFLLYINDLPKCLGHSIARLFADDTNVTFTGCNIESIQEQMTSDLNNIFQWLCSNKLTLNVLKTDFMLIGSRQKLSALEDSIVLSANDVALSKVRSVKCLGVDIDENITWETHIQSIRLKVSRNIAALRKVKKIFNRGNLVSLYRALIEPYFIYCSIVWDNINETLDKQLQILQNRAARIITGAPLLKSSSLILAELSWMNIKEMREKQKAILMYKIVHGLAPDYLTEMFTFSSSLNDYSLRQSKLNLELPVNRTDYYNSSFAFTGAKLWNSLPDELKQEPSLKRFIKRLEHLLSAPTY